MDQLKLEELLNKWVKRANYFESLAGYDNDIFAQLNKFHAKIIRECINDLGHEIDK